MFQIDPDQIHAVAQRRGHGGIGEADACSQAEMPRIQLLAETPHRAKHCSPPRGITKTRRDENTKKEHFDPFFVFSSLRVFVIRFLRQCIDLYRRGARHANGFPLQIAVRARYTEVSCPTRGDDSCSDPPLCSASSGLRRRRPFALTMPKRSSKRRSAPCSPRPA